MTVKMPEPMKYLYRVKGFDGVNTVLVENIDGRAVLETFHLITTEQAEAYAQARVNEVLDMMADKASKKYLMPEFASAIRSLKEQS